MGRIIVFLQKNKTIRTDFCKLFDAKALPSYISPE